MKVFITLCLILSVTGLSYQCSCLPLNVKNQFCSADLVAKVKVLSGKQVLADNENEVYYNVAYEFNYKADDRMKVPEMSGKLFTASSSAACGRDFEEGVEYVIAGYLHEGRLSTHLCSLGFRVDQLNEEDKKFFDNDYKTVKC